MMAPLIVLTLGLAAAVVIDLRTRRIPNWLTAGMAAGGFGIACGGGAVTPAHAALGMLAGLLLMMPGHLIGALGAGDVKLMASIGAVVGPGMVLRAFLFTALAGGLFAIAVAVQRGLLADTLNGTGHLIVAPSSARRTIEAPSRANRFAYGPAIAAGTLVAVLI
jgi:prepilin peptidase CpaA